MQEQHRDGKRIKLKIAVDAPEVVIPVQPDSHHTVVVDLGKISLSNSFFLMEVKGRNDPTKQLAIIEDMVIKLSSLQLFRFVCAFKKLSIYF